MVDIICQLSHNALERVISSGNRETFRLSKFIKSGLMKLEALNC